MRKTYELVVVKGILTKSTCTDAHTTVNITIELCLRTIILFEICDKLRRSRGKLKYLRLTLKVFPILEDLFLCGLVFELNMKTFSWWIKKAV